MPTSRKYFFIVLFYSLSMILFIAGFRLKINSLYSPDLNTGMVRKNLARAVFVPSPAIVPAGRNIAFENSNAVSNAPASYLTMLDCCESDEAISDRIAVGKTQCRIIRNSNEPTQ